MATYTITPITGDRTPIEVEAEKVDDTSQPGKVRFLDANGDPVAVMSNISFVKTA